MPINTGRISVPPDDTTMIIYRSKTPVDPQRKRDLARRCGVECIKLMYKDFLSTSVGVSGFQRVNLLTQPGKGGRIEPTARWHKNEYTNEPMFEGSMDFVPDEMGTGWAFLPDSPGNRVRLACAEMANNAVWEIDDKNVLKEIQELAIEIQNSIEHKKLAEASEMASTEVNVRVREKGVVSGVEHKSRLENEIAVIKDKIKELEQLKIRSDLKKQLAELQADYPEIAAVSESKIPKEDTDGDTKFQKPAETFASIDARKQAKADVYSQNRELIDSVKDAHIKATGSSKGWGWSKEYKEKVEPLIETRIKELTRTDEHSTTGIAT
jgi:hypothetical protein